MTYDVFGGTLNSTVQPQRSRLHGHKVQKRISVEGDRVAGVSLQSIECPFSSYCCVLLQIVIESDSRAVQYSSFFVHSQKPINASIVFDLSHEHLYLATLTKVQ